MGRFDWNNDKSRLQSERLSVGADFNPEVGFLRRTAFKRSYSRALAAVRATSAASGKLFYIASLDYITDTKNHPESKKAQGNFQMELTDGEPRSPSTSVATTNGCRPASRWDATCSCRPASIRMTQSHATYLVRGSSVRCPGRSPRRAAASTAVPLTELTWSGRVELSRQVYVEPQLSWNRVDVPQGKANGGTLLSARGTYTLSTRMFVSALVRSQSRTTASPPTPASAGNTCRAVELFVVYSDGRTTLDARGYPDLQNRSFVVKATRLLRW